MNYSRVRLALKEKQKQLQKMNGKDRTAFEKKIVQDAIASEESVVESSKEELGEKPKTKVK